MRKKMRLTSKYKITEPTPGKHRLVFQVDEVIEQPSGSSLNNRLFLYQKPGDEVGEISVADAEYLGLAPVEIFNNNFKREYGEAYPGAWSDLPQAVPVYAPDTTIDDATVPSDTALGNYVQDRLVTSSVLVYEGDMQSVYTTLNNIKDGLRNLQTYYGAYANITTAIDTTTYPEGWEASVL